MPKFSFVDPDDFDERRFWTPEYVPESVMPPTRGVAQNTLTVRSTSISPAMIMEDQPMMRKTKIVCTMGPKCWDEESMGKLIDAGMGRRALQLLARVTRGSPGGAGSLP